MIFHFPLNSSMQFWDLVEAGGRFHITHPEQSNQPEGKRKIIKKKRRENVYRIRTTDEDVDVHSRIRAVAPLHNTD